MADEFHPKLHPVRAFQARHACNEEGEPETSLSEFHDYEPNLEFDDCELVLGGLAPLPPELLDVDETYVQRSASDGTIEENFEHELAAGPPSYAEIVTTTQDEEHYAQLAASGVVEVIGDDELGRRVILISACRLPPAKDVPNEKLLQFLMHTLDKHVEQDYSLVYFHYGLASSNMPSLSWLWQAYKAFDRKYKKNLKALYLVHPTSFVRVVWQVLRPALSVKFGKKLKYVNYLHELQALLHVDTTSIPGSVLEYDKMLLSKNRRAALAARQQIASSSAAGTSGAGSSKAGSASQGVDMNATNAREKPSNDSPQLLQQIGVPLEFILVNHPGVVDSVPPLVRSCVDFLSQPDALETEGLFRRSIMQTNIARMVTECNSGGTIDFKGDPHSAAVLLKHFLRNLTEPLLTYQLYSEVLQYQTWSIAKRPKQVKVLLLEKLPLENYKLLKFIVKFLSKVADRRCLNKMTMRNLSIVFGPNLMWPQNKDFTLKQIETVNSFTEFILENQEEIFII